MKTKKLSAVAIILIIIVVAASPTRAVQIISTFDSSNEGWTPYLNTGAIEYLPTGGKPDGHIYANDATNDWAYLQAPSKFDVASLYNGALSFDLKAFSDSSNYPVKYNVRAALIGNGLTLINESILPTSSWVNYNFILNETDGWRIFPDLQRNYNNAAPLPSQTQMQGVLANLNGLFIATDYTDGTLLVGAIDRTYLDNVRLDVATAAVPEPATFVLLGIGLAGLCLKRV